MRIPSNHCPRTLGRYNGHHVLAGEVPLLELPQFRRANLA